jgi:hypothetical protein
VSGWIEVLKREVKAKGPKIVAQELGLNRTTIDLIVQQKYQASTDKVLERVKKVYGHDGNVLCPVLDIITPLRCADLWNKAKKIGMKASNPETLRLYKYCLTCSVRTS